MRKIKFLIVFLISFCAFNFYGQKKKEIKKYAIKTVTTTKILGAKSLKDEKLSYNGSGLLAEECKYDDQGELEYIVKYKYNVDEDVIEELNYDSKNMLTERRTMKYNVLSQKTEELVADKDGKQIKKFTYSYNSKGLRTEKKTFDTNNHLVITKNIGYTYK